MKNNMIKTDWVNLIGGKETGTATAWENVVVQDNEVDLSTFSAMRKRYGSQDDIAAVLGLTDRMIISKFENGKANIDKRTYSLFLLVTNNHPHYTLELKQDPDSEILAVEPPNGEGIRLIREYAGITQGKMAFLLGMMNKPKTVSDQGKPEKDKPNRQLVSRYEKGTQSPSVQSWTLFLLIIGEHPNYAIFPKLDDLEA